MANATNKICYLTSHKPSFVKALTYHSFQPLPHPWNVMITIRYFWKPQCLMLNVTYSPNRGGHCEEDHYAAGKNVAQRSFQEIIVLKLCTI